MSSLKAPNFLFINSFFLNIINPSSLINPSLFIIKYYNLIILLLNIINITKEIYKLLKI
jgi:hypothetical protein